MDDNIRQRVEECLQKAVRARQLSVQNANTLRASQHTRGSIYRQCSDGDRMFDAVQFARSGMGALNTLLVELLPEVEPIIVRTYGRNNDRASRRSRSASIQGQVTIMVHSFTEPIDDGSLMRFLLRCILKSPGRCAVTLASQVAEIKDMLFRKKLGNDAGHTSFAEKVARSSQKNPSACSFNIWHANKDNNIGTDSPWGTTK